MSRARIRRRMLAAARYDVRNRKLTGQYRWRKATSRLARRMRWVGEQLRSDYWIPS